MSANLREGLIIGDLFEFRLGEQRLPRTLSSGWERRKGELAKGAVDDFGEFDQLVLSEAKLACKRREAMTGYRWAIDHMIPLRRGGKHAWWNIQVIPYRLNSLKGDRLIYTLRGEWIETLPGAKEQLL